MPSKTKHPMQPVKRDRHGVVRFHANAIVRYLLDYATARGCGMNELALMRFSKDDRTQFAQLIGYSVSGAGDLSYFDRATLSKADRQTEALLRRRSTR